MSHVSLGEIPRLYYQINLSFMGHTEQTSPASAVTVADLDALGGGGGEMREQEWSENFGR